MSNPVLRPLAKKTDKAVSDQSFSVYEHEQFAGSLRAYLFYQQTNEANEAAWTIGAWARRLKLSRASTLSNILAGRKVPSRELGLQIIQSMHLDPASSEYLVLLLEAELNDDCVESVQLGIRRRLHILKMLAKRFPLSLEDSEAVSRHAVLSIRELALLPDFKPESEWIRSRLRLDVSHEESERAILTLVRAGLLVEKENGKFELSRGYYETPADTPSELIRRFHFESLDYAKTCLDSVPVEDRYVISNFLTIKKSDLPRLKESVEEFRKEINSVYDRTDLSGEEVYQFNLQLLPLTHPKPNTDRKSENENE